MSTDSILVWMLSLNREYSREEYDQAYQLCKLCFPNERFKYEYANADSFRVLFYPAYFNESVHLTILPGSLMTQLLPVLMMRHRRVPRAKWKDHQTPAGKHWIDVVRVRG
jgi:hypothetical protein